MSRPFTVAIDGPAASGKGTISRAVAQRFGFGHLDTGLLYRAVGARLLEGEDPVSAAKALMAADLERDNLRSHAVADAASRVAAIPEVRAALVDFQQAFARRAGGAVLDGRDIGTVICPDAEVKLFVTAEPETRAERRYHELIEQGETVTEDEVLQDVLARDMRDRTRSVAPMPSDHGTAALIDTTALSIEAAVQRAVEEVEKAWSKA